MPCVLLTDNTIMIINYCVILVLVVGGRTTLCRQREITREV